MIPLGREAVASVLGGEESTRRAVALRHALIRERGTWWGDRPRRPSSVVLLRDGDGQVEAFGAGEPGPAADWLAGRDGPVALLAPKSWLGPICEAVGPVETGRIEVRFRPEPAGSAAVPPPSVAVRRLTEGDVTHLAAILPTWGWRGWGSPRELIEEGSAFGVPFDGGLAAIAWVLEQDHAIDLVGVYVAPRYRRLGLGHAVASGLVGHVVSGRRKCPVWAGASENLASRQLARRLGFRILSHETLLRWPPRQGATEGEDGRREED